MADTSAGRREAPVGTGDETRIGLDLFSPLTIRGITLRNRVAVSPMCMYSCEDGMATDFHLVHLGSRAMGGAGLVMVEATAVTPEGRISAGDMGLWKDEQIEPLARIARFVESQGAVPAIQLAHAGRKAACRPPLQGGGPVAEGESGWWRTIGPSEVAFDTEYQVPHAMSRDEIEAVIEAWVAATRRALQAGFRVIEIHAAHGYLLNEFLSPMVNRRTDEYGGSRDNRMRLVLEVAGRVRAAMPESLPLFVRISATDWAEGGWGPDDSVALAHALKPVGVDLIDCSSGAVVPHVHIPLGPGYQVPFAEKIKAETCLLTGAVGLITTPQQANQIITTGQADLVLLAREHLRRPYWVLDASRELDEPVEYWPPQYGYAIKQRR